MCSYSALRVYTLVPTILIIVSFASAMALLYTVEPPNKGHFGNASFVLYSEVVSISEVHHILVLFHVILGRNTQLSFM